MNASTTAGVANELKPPADLELTPPQPVAPVQPEVAAGRVKLKPEDVKELDAQVREFIHAVVNLDQNDPKFKDCVERIHSMGSKEIERSASVSNRMLERPVKTMKNGLFDSGSEIS